MKTVSHLFFYSPSNGEEKMNRPFCILIKICFNHKSHNKSVSPGFKVIQDDGFLLGPIARGIGRIRSISKTPFLIFVFSNLYNELNEVFQILNFTSPI